MATVQERAGRTLAQPSPPPSATSPSGRRPASPGAAGSSC